MFKLKSTYKPTGDQPQAIERLVIGVRDSVKHQVLLGVTGSGKTFTVANVIEKTQLPTLVISHNKTLAAQLYQELRDFFPGNAISYFVSYYDYYQPEAYIPQTDTYIEKETEINEEIDKLRLRATANILTRRDTIVVASVSCIYNIGSPREYGNFVLELSKGQVVNQREILKRLVELQYERGDFGFHRGTFRVRGDTIDIFPAYEDFALRVELDGNRVERLEEIDPLNGNCKLKIENLILYPAKHYMTNPETYANVFPQIREDLAERVTLLKKQGRELEAHRLAQRVNYDLEMIQEVGYVNGIENYSRYFDGRSVGEPPYSLLDYYHEAYGDDFLVVIDESHMAVPQIGGMYNGDFARKKTLVDFGFRLPAAFDNRPLRFEEFLRRVPRTIYTSATPAKWELSIAKDYVVEQLIRPTGIPDPEIDIRPTQGQIDDLISEIEARAKKGQRTLVTTLTKRIAEDLSTFLQERGMKVHYLHSDVATLDRTDILDDLRLGKYDVLVGINLLREGLDLPEVSLVAILDADKEGFLRSETSLIQVMGRAARHIEGKVIMYADQTTGSMERAIKEVDRRRNIQLEYNKKHGITPKTIIKPIRAKLVERDTREPEPLFYGIERQVVENLEELDIEDMTPQDRRKLIQKLRRAMNASAADLNFELAARFRDRICEIEAMPF
ncbi:MAG: excinuclease ABC subunit UvrB [bacterium]|nr:excinuclease ABC subunit UvrB [bacterium]